MLESAIHAKLHLHQLHLYHICELAIPFTLFLWGRGDNTVRAKAGEEVAGTNHEVCCHWLNVREYPNRQ